MAVIGAVMVPHPPLIIPEVGRGEEKAIQKTIDAYHQAAKEIAALQPETIVVTTPHSIMYGDYFHISPGYDASGDFGQFRVAGVRIHTNYDTAFVEELCAEADEHGFMAGTLGERDSRLDHGMMIPLYFIDQEYTDYQTVRIGLSGLSFADHYTLGQYIQETAIRLGRRTVIVASGDLSHRLKEDGPYGYQEEGPQYDKRIMEVMGRGKFGELFEFSENFCQKAGECGHRSFLILAGAMDRMKVKAEALSYEGPFGVGYGVCTFRAEGADENRNFKDQYEERQREKMREKKEQEDAYVRLARRSLEGYMIKRVPIEVPDDVPQELLEKKAGVFVSLKKDGRLRGCIGTIAPTTGSVAEEIIQNAVSAAVSDRRFSEVAYEELPYLEYSVDVLETPEDIQTPDQLDVKKYGLIITKGRKRGLLLPNLEGVDTVEEQIAITKQKAGIDADDEDVQMQRFEVVRHR